MIEFLVPYESPTSNIALPDPQHGNTESVEIKTEFRRALSGKVYSFIYTPDTATHTFSLSKLTREKKNELLTFLRSCVGVSVRYKDWNGVWYKIKFKMPETRVEGSGTDVYDVSLTFEVL